MRRQTGGSRSIRSSGWAVVFTIGWMPVPESATGRSFQRIFLFALCLAASLLGFSCPRTATAGIVNAAPLEGSFQYLPFICGAAAPWTSSESGAASEVVAQVETYNLNQCGPVTMTPTGDWPAPPPQPVNLASCGPGVDPILPVEILGIEGVNYKPYQLTFYNDYPGQCHLQTDVMEILRERNVHCPAGSGWNGTECIRSSSTPDRGSNAGGGGGPSGPQCTGKGNDAADPCNAGTGNEFHIETDYRGSGPFPLTFTRTYNAMSYDSEVGNTLGVIVS